MHISAHVIFVALLMFATTYAFQFSPLIKHGTSSKSSVEMGLFDFLGPKKSATASHILVSGIQIRNAITKQLLIIVLL
jgi:hypothetical protein